MYEIEKFEMYIYSNRNVWNKKNVNVGTQILIEIYEIEKY